MGAMDGSVLLHSQDIFKSMRVADITFKRNSEFNEGFMKKLHTCECVSVLWTVALRLRQAEWRLRPVRVMSARTWDRSRSVAVFISLNWRRNATTARHSDSRRECSELKYSLKDCKTIDKTMKTTENNRKKLNNGTCTLKFILRSNFDNKQNNVLMIFSLKTNFRS